MRAESDDEEQFVVAPAGANMRDSLVSSGIQVSSPPNRVAVCGCVYAYVLICQRQLLYRTREWPPANLGV